MRKKTWSRTMTNRSDWWTENHVPREPEDPVYRKEFRRLGSHIQDYHPDYGVGDCVRLRTAPWLGPLTYIGTVRRFVWFGAHLCAVVQFPDGRTMESSTSAFVRADGTFHAA